MSTNTFEIGYKLIKRYFKEIGRYPEFIKITTENDPSYKTKLKKQFDEKKMGWDMFFTYTWFVGENYEQYNDPSLNNLRNGWINFIQNNKPDLFKIDPSNYI